MSMTRALAAGTAVFLSLALFCDPAFAAAGLSGGEGARQSLNLDAIIIFALFVALTLGITWWAGRRTQTAQDFYAAGSSIGGFKNGVAISGDFMSAATLLGITALIFGFGFDSVVYIVTPLTGLALLLFVIAEPLRNLGRYTFADVASIRLQRRPIRMLAALGSLAVVMVYMIAQMVGAGELIQVLFGLDYAWAVIMVGVLMVLYVSIGGMIATTWVQIIKAILLFSGVVVLTGGVLFLIDFDIAELYRRAIDNHRLGEGMMGTGTRFTNPLATISVAVGNIFGFAALPHILMRLFTVPDAKQARRSVFFAIAIIALVFVMIFFIVGFGTVVFVTGPEYLDEAGHVIGGHNMPAIHLSQVVGGDFFMGFISAVAFATILAVVAGLTLAGASAISHDLYANFFRHERSTEKDEVRVSRIATVCIGLLAIALGIAFEGKNVVALAARSLAIAACVNFPILILAIYWRGLTTRGALVGGYFGLIGSVGIIVGGPTVWRDIMGNVSPLWPYEDPALFALPVALILTWLFSVTDKSQRAQRERAAFDDQAVRMQTGYGVSEAIKH